MKIICIGRNYADHIEELNNERPESPVIFSKPPSAILPEGNVFEIPEWTNNVHHEIEIVVKINQRAKNLSPEEAEHIFEEYTLGIDFTARDLQSKLKAKGLPWETAKGFDGSAPLGSLYLSKKEVPLTDLNFSLNKNGQPQQVGNTKMMIWKINELIAHISKFFTLEEGDLIFTGTPAGVSQVTEGDILDAFIEDQQILRLQVK